MAEEVSILSEIDEALRADRLQAFWMRNRSLLITFCILAVLSTIASVLWKNHLHDVHLRETGVLADAAALEQKGKTAEAAALYQGLETEGTPLAALAGIRHAALLIGMQQNDRAMALYQSVAGNGEAPAALRDFAGFQAFILASNRKAEMKNAPALPGSSRDNVFRDSDNEIRALTAIKGGDRKTARALLSEIVSDEAAPYSQRVRAEQLSETIREHTP